MDDQELEQLFMKHPTLTDEEVTAVVAVRSELDSLSPTSQRRVLTRLLKRIEDR